MSPVEIAVLIFILTAFGVFMATLAWASRQPRTTIKPEKRNASRAVEPAAGLNAQTVFLSHCPE
jgi:hypothetical protein